MVRPGEKGSSNPEPRPAGFLTPAPLFLFGLPCEFGLSLLSVLPSCFCFGAAHSVYLILSPSFGFCCFLSQPFGFSFGSPARLTLSLRKCAISLDTNGTFRLTSDSTRNLKGC